ncbi:MAG: DNA glycosylase AlkZ-like family protein [Anaerolineae bacterium]
MRRFDFSPLPMQPILITKQAARRFVLGRQGLWPGRRWRGKKGTAQAMLACEAVQLDPLQATARSQDLVLHSRVLDYKPQYLDEVLYRDRKFFDYGGWLAVYPMSELPYWRVHMERRSHDKRVEDFTFTHPGIFERVRTELQQRGPLGNRHLDGNAVGWNYRGRKDTSLALFDMWLSGEVMIHHRENFSRVYDFRENIAPPELDYVASEPEAEEFFARKCIAFKGLLPEARWKYELEYYIRRKLSRQEMNALQTRWMDAGIIVPVRVEDDPGSYLLLSQDLPLLHKVMQGSVPRTWKPLDVTTLDEVTLLSSLDIVSARGRALKLFDFEFLWEVYKPAHQRRWGYYTLPILYGDQLVARLDPKLDRASMTLLIKGFWHEDGAPVKDESFISALANGLLRFARFLRAERINLSGIALPALRRRLKSRLGEDLPVTTRPIPLASALEE